MTTSTQRESRKFWAVVDGGVREVVGYTCGPDNPTMWWCPSVMMSMSEGHHLFPTRPQAILAARRELLAKRAKIDAQLEAL